MRSAGILAAAVAVVFVLALASGIAAAARKRPRACAALTFRPVPMGLADGPQNAGFYHSRFGRIEVVAVVKDGAAQSYFVEVDGKRPTAISGKLPKSVAACARIKRLGPIGKPPAKCRGDKLAVLIEHSTAQRYVALYAHRGHAWHFCSIGGA